LSKGCLENRAGYCARLRGMQQLPDLSQLTTEEKNELIRQLFAAVQALRARLRSSEQHPEECQVDHLQVGIQFGFAVLR